MEYIFKKVWQTPKGRIFSCSCLSWSEGLDPMAKCCLSSHLTLLPSRNVRGWICLLSHRVAIPLGSYSLALLLERSHVHGHRPELHELDLHGDEEWTFLWLQERTPSGKGILHFHCWQEPQPSSQRIQRGMSEVLLSSGPLCDVCEHRPP